MADGLLVTERLRLRPAEAADLPWIMERINTAAMMRHLGGAAQSSEAVAESLKADIAAFHAPEGHQRWTVLRSDTSERVGRVGLFRVRSPAAPAALRGQREVGWMVAEPHWGNGYATEAAAAVLDWAFAFRLAPVIYSQTSDSNRASTQVMRRLGLARCAEFDYLDPDYPAQDNPTTVWSVTADSWSRLRG